MKNKSRMNGLKTVGLQELEHFQHNRDKLRSQQLVATKHTASQGKLDKKDSTRAAIDKINQNREKRRKKMEEVSFVHHNYFFIILIFWIKN